MYYVVSSLFKVVADVEIEVVYNAIVYDVFNVQHGGYSVAPRYPYKKMFKRTSHTVLYG